MKYLILLLALILCSGCTNSYGSEYTLYIPPELNSKTENVILAAFKWTQAVGVAINPIIAHNDDCSEPGNICLYIASEEDLISIAGEAPADAWIAGNTVRDHTDFSRIFILDMLVTDVSDPKTEDDILNSLNLTLVHELGHALGLKHEPQMGNVMYPEIPGQVSFPTCTDRKQYFSLRGINLIC